MEDFYYPNLRKKSEPVVVAEDGPEKEENDSESEIQEEESVPEKRSWLKSIYDFAKHAFEEEK